MRIKLNSLESITNINPFLRETLKGTEYNLDTHNKMLVQAKMPITLGGVSIPSDCYEILDNEKTSIKKGNYDDLINKISEDFHKSEDIMQCILDAFDLGHNVLLYGPGGYGKSEVTLAVFDALYEKGIIDEKPFIMSLSEGTTDEELYGNIDLKAMKNDEIIYNVKNSFMNHKYVIFEEMFDAQAQTLTALKDIMTSKRFRKGSQNVAIRTEMFIGITNKSKHEFATNESTKALLDRFAYSLKVDWEGAVASDYVNMFKKVFKDYTPEDAAEFITIANLVIKCNSSGGFLEHISIRTALAIMKTHLASKSLKFIEGISHSTIDTYNRVVKAGKEEYTLEQEYRVIVDRFIEVLTQTKIIPTVLTRASTLHVYGAEVFLNKLTNNVADFEPTLNIDTYEYPGLAHNAEFSTYIEELEQMLVASINAEDDEIKKERLVLLFAEVSLIKYSNK